MEVQVVEVFGSKFTLIYLSKISKYSNSAERVGIKKLFIYEWLENILWITIFDGY